MEEIWKDIEGFEGEYQISNFGRIKSLERYVLKKVNEKILNSSFSSRSCGYFHVPLRGQHLKKDVLVHRELAKAFIPIPDELKHIPIENLVVNHKDENKLNNSLDNLEWCTYQYNNTYGTKKLREIETQRRTHPRNKAIIQLSRDGRVLANFRSEREASRELGIPHSNISECINGKRKTAGGYVWKFKD